MRYLISLLLVASLVSSCAVVPAGDVEIEAEGTPVIIDVETEAVEEVDVEPEATPTPIDEEEPVEEEPETTSTPVEEEDPVEEEPETTPTPVDETEPIDEEEPVEEEPETTPTPVEEADPAAVEPADEEDPTLVEPAVEATPVDEEEPVDDELTPTPTPTPADEEEVDEELTPTPTPVDEEEIDEEEVDEEEVDPEEEPVTGVVITEGTVQEPLEMTEPVGLQLVTEGLTAPVYLTTAPGGNGELFILDQTGEIYVIDSEGERLEEPFLDLSDQIVELRPGFDERGLLGLAFHPDYAENGRFFVYYSAPLRDGAPEGWDHTSHVSEFSVSEDDEFQADPDSERIIMEIDQPQFNHNGGTVIFGPDGFLYISLGDGGGANDTGIGHPPIGNGQDTNTLLGTILRIHVDGAEPYEIPFDNPFLHLEPEDVIDDEDLNGEEEDANGEEANGEEANGEEENGEENGNGDEADDETEIIDQIDGLGEIWAYGLRNPYRISWDMEGDNGEGRLYIADVGQHLFEEVNIGQMGANYGWNIKEGTHCFSPDSPFEPPEECPDTGPHGEELVDPVIEYLNVKAEGGLGSSIIGGYIYRGSALADFEGDYIFGDYSYQQQELRGRIFVSTPEEAEDGLWSMREIPIAEAEDGQLGLYLLAFGKDQDNELYVLTTASSGPTGETGRVYRMVPAEEGEPIEPVDEEPVDEEEQAEEEPAEEEPTPTPTPTPVDEEEVDEEPAPTPTPVDEEEIDEEEVDEEAEEVNIDLEAVNIEFDQETITVPAGARVVIEFTNNDSVEHNFALYETESAANEIFVGELIGGPGETITYEFDAPDEPGTYFFRCDPHPVEMTGDFIVE